MTDATKGKCHECGFEASINDTFLEGAIELDIMDDEGNIEYEDEFMLICPICHENQW